MHRNTVKDSIDERVLYSPGEVSFGCKDEIARYMKSSMTFVRMLIQDADVNFAPDCPTTRIVVDSDTAKTKVFQEQANTLFNIQTKKWVDRCDAYEQNKSVICVVSSQSDATPNSATG
jgi:hypothetical protein